MNANANANADPRVNSLFKVPDIKTLPRFVN
jgi:hypothetical protein